MEEIPLFSISPNPSVLYQTPKLKEAIVQFRLAIARKQGLCMILGDVGLGKSTLLRYIASNYDQDENCKVSYLHDSRKTKTPFDLLKVISADFGLPMKRSQTAQLTSIEDFLASTYEAGQTAIVFIDEGQRIPSEGLELLRSLLNYETATHKLLQVVVAGQLDLRDKLIEARMKAFRSRIVAPLVIDPLTEPETIAMIHQRLESWNVENPFIPAALHEIYTLSGGVPRQILLLCQRSRDLANQDKPGRLVTEEDVRTGALRLDIEAQKPVGVSA
jgi:general secretion pathway protein A